MVYKINFELTNSFQNFFNYLESIGDFLYLNKTIYLETDEHKSDVLRQLKKIINDEEQVMIKAVDIDSNDYPIQIQYWIDNIKAKQHMRLIEEQRQQSVKSVYDFITAFENELKKQLENNE